MDFHFAVVTDESESAEFVHEETYPRPGCPDHVCERLLADLRNDRLGFALLAEIRQQQKSPRQTFFAGVEQLIDQVRFDANRAGEKMRDEHFGEGRMFM